MGKLFFSFLLLHPISGSNEFYKHFIFKTRQKKFQEEFSFALVKFLKKCHKINTPSIVWIHWNVTKNYGAFQCWNHNKLKKGKYHSFKDDTFIVKNTLLYWFWLHNFQFSVHSSHPRNLNLQSSIGGTGSIRFFLSFVHREWAISSLFLFQSFKKNWFRSFSNLAFIFHVFRSFSD